MDSRLKDIVDYLNSVETRCTYGVIAEILEVNVQSVGAMLGNRCPWASWVVNAKTGEPTDYSESEKHPNLYRKKHIIKSAEVIRRNLEL